MKILLVSSLFFPVQGGAENQALLLCRMFRKLGDSILVLTQQLDEAETTVPDLDGIPIFRELPGSRWGRFRGIWYFISALLFFVRRRDDYDVIHCQQTYIHTWSAHIAGRILNKPVVSRVACTGLNGDLERLFDVRLSRILGGCLRKIDQYVVLNRDGVAELRAIGVPAERIELIPNGVQAPMDDTFSPVSECLQGLRILFVGRVERVKGIFDLVSAISLLPPGILSQLTVLGSGVKQSELEQRIVDLGIDGLVRLEGQSDDVGSFMNRADLLVLPSYSEGMSNTVLEASAVGLPVLGTRIPGIEELVVPGETGWLVEPGDVKGIAAMITSIAAMSLQERRSVGLKAKEKILENYSIERAADRYRQLYQRLGVR